MPEPPTTGDTAPAEAPLSVLVDALHPRARRAEHPRALVAALEAMGVPATLEFVSPGRWPVLSTGAEGLDLPAGPRPRARIAYDPFSPAAWLGARLARRDGAPLLIVEPGWTGLRRLHERLLENLGNQLWGRTVRGACGRLMALDPLGEQRALARGFGSDRVALVPTGVDVERFQPGLSSRLVGRHRLVGRLLVAVGPLEAGRGLEVLLGAFASSVGQRPDWSLVLVGEGPLERRLSTTADRLGVGAAVHILPWQNDGDLAGLLAAATLFAAPDEGDGASGAQVVRAMAAGLPVLVADRPRLAHLVRDGVDGRLVRPGDREAWLGALLAAAGSPDARARWGRAAREQALVRHAWPRVASSVLALLGELEQAERHAAPVGA